MGTASRSLSPTSPTVTSPGWSCAIASAPRIEDRIRCGKATGLRNLPFDLLRRNAVWVELVLMACDLVAWCQALLLDGELAVAEPKTLRYRLLHVAARMVRHARRMVLRLQASWPWAAELARAFARLRALPLRC
jgi:hypothetical protein